jgi:hypothetical protein
MEQQLNKRTAPCSHRLALWIIYLGFAWLAFSGFVRMMDSFVNWYWYGYVRISPGPWYLAVSGGLWGLSGLLALVWLLFSFPWRRQIAAGAALFYGLTYWIDRLFVNNREGALPNSPFAILLTFLGLGIVFLVLQPWNDLWVKKERHNDQK